VIEERKKEIWKQWCSGCGPERKEKADGKGLSEMSVDEFFQGGFDIPEEPQRKGGKVSKGKEVPEDRKEKEDRRES
jgi:hypothetical protein